MSRLSFRARLFLALLTATVLPVVIVTGAGVYVLQNLPSVQVAKAVSDLERTFITLNRELALDSLREGSLLALDRHRTTVGYIVEKTPLAIDIKESVPQVFGAVMLIAAVVMILTVMFVGRTLSAQLSAPLDEVVEWTGRIQRHEALDTATPDHGGIPEFAKLRAALRNLAHGLEQARAAELEAERLRAFGEVARRVAHEMKNPLTPIRLAVSQLSRNATSETREVLDVIAVESARLEAMAREFAELGRLPEGIAAPVDLRELIDDLLRSTVPDSMLRHFIVEPDVPEVDGYYDPLRRAFSNIFRNAVDACRGDGSLAVRLRPGDGWVEVLISDNGPGVPEGQREMIFRPYYTDKRDGTGLGLAIVRQTIEQHGGTISVSETPGGGATFCRTDGDPGFVMGFRTGLFLAADSAPMSPSLATLPLNAQPEVRVRWTRAEWMLVIGATALAVGLGWLGRAQEIGVDEATHLALAKSIASGHYRDEFLVGRPVHAKYPPLMSLWLVVIRFVTGSSLDAVRAVNLVLHALSATIIGDSLRRLGWPRLGVAALAVIALNPSLLDLAGTIRSETLYITLTSVALWSSLQHEWGAVRHGIVTIAAAGAAFLTRSAGIAIVAAVAIVGARRHRFFVLGMALAMITIVATWFLFSFGLGGDGGGGASYAFDLSRIASTPVTAIRHAGAVMLEYAIRTPFTQFGLPNLPTKLDTMVAGIGIPAFAVLGMIRIARTWPIAVVNLVLGLGVLLVWPWIDGRFLAPLVPSLVAMMLIGIADGSRRWAGVRAEWVAVATAIVFVLSAVGTGVRTAKIGLSCRQEAASLVDPRCNHTETRAIAPASRFVRDSVPRDAVIATPKNALVYHISGHETVRYYTRAADGQLAFLAPQSGVDYLIVATIGVGFGRQVLAELASACGSLRVVREFPLETILLARRLAGDGPESACTTVSRIQSRTMRRE